MGLKQIIFGGAVGAVLGVLYAPRAGKKTRAMLADKTESLWGEEAQANGTILGEVAKTTNTAVKAGKDLFNEAAAGKVGVITKDLNQKRQEFNRVAGERIGEFTQTNVRPVFSERNDELRQKIEEARKKIAKQVASNLSEHQTSNEIKTKAYVKTKSSSSSTKKPGPKKKTTAASKNTTKKSSTKTSKAAPKKTTTKKTTAKKTTKKPVAKKTTRKTSR